MLTTLSALSDVSLAVVKHEALKIAGKDNWEEILHNHPLYWHTIKKLKKILRIKKEMVPDDAGIFFSGNTKRTLPKGKSGSITSRQWFKDLAHIDPFWDGKVWGTFGEYPMTIEEYTKLMNEKLVSILGIYY